MILFEACAMLPASHFKNGNASDQLFFDMAEAVENGGWRGLVSTLAQAPAPESTLEAQQLTMLYLKDLQWRKLWSAKGETLLIAKPVEGGRRFNIFAARACPKPLAPKIYFSHDFDLVAGGRGGREWVLSSLSCERCEARGRRTCGAAPLARIRRLADRSDPAAGVEVELPSLREDGSRSCMCDICGDASAKWAPELVAQTGFSKSAKSVEFVPASQSTGAPCLRVSKAGEDSIQCKSVLEYHAPLGVLQAFAAALVASQ